MKTPEPIIVGVKREPSSFVHDRRACTDAGIVQRADHFEASEHAVGAVELAARGLRVEMAADDDRVRVGLRAASLHEDVSDRIDARLEPGLARPGDEPVAALAIDFGQREALYAAFRRRPDPGQVHQRAP
jgi:hypothetical protein